MFCYQCEQTAKGEGCTVHGVCGKDPDVAALQDLLRQVVMGLSVCAHRARKGGKRNKDVDEFVPWALFTTLTNVNFDARDFENFIHRGAELREIALDMCGDLDVGSGDEMAWIENWHPAQDLEGLIAQGEDVGVQSRIDRFGPDIAGLQELIVYGLKGAGAYTYHARVLGQGDEELYDWFHEMLSYIASGPCDQEELLNKALETGELNLRAMKLLDAGNTGTYGHPEPTKVRVTPVQGKAIVVSGHDLKDLKELLEQTRGTGVKVYTHGEMLPCHGYPELNKYDHLVGNYGGAWQLQRKEFEKFPGAILMTTNCLMKPKNSYKDRIFTSGPTGWPGVTHIGDGDYSPVIEAALSQPGFQKDGEPRTITVGFGRDAVNKVADQVIEAVGNGDIRHFFLIGGCDGAKPGRNYYTELAQSVPSDCIILTLACGKYRFNKLDFGDIGGIPRLLDIGQCNDAYSAIQIALALSKALDSEVNDLPLSFVLSWYEQKAVAILLTLLYLGIEDMRLGPTLPAFVEPMVLDVLVDKFNIMPISNPKEDLKEILGE